MPFNVGFDQTNSQDTSEALHLPHILGDGLRIKAYELKRGIVLYKERNYISWRARDKLNNALDHCQSASVVLFIVMCKSREGCQRDAGVGIQTQCVRYCTESSAERHIGLGRPHPAGVRPVGSPRSRACR